MGCNSSKALDTAPASNLKEYGGGDQQQIEIVVNGSGEPSATAQTVPTPTPTLEPVSNESNIGAPAPTPIITTRNSHDRLALQELHNDFVKGGDLNERVVRFEAALGTPIAEVYDGVRNGQELGKGAFGVVRKVTHRKTGMEYAVKCIQLNQFPNAEAYQQMREEIWVLCQLDHPNIVRITEVYESFDEIFIVQELCKGGDLFDRLEDQMDEADRLNQTGLYFSEAQCAGYVRQMLAATQYLHSKGIVHRDLKLEHFMFSTPASSELRMIDFGFSKHLDDSGFMCGVAGTTYTKAPEVIHGSRYNEKFDVWSVGVLAYLLLAGDTPYGSLDDSDSRRSINCKQAIISEGTLVFEPTDKWQLVSDEAENFIRRLLRRDPSERPSAAEALGDEWITKWTRGDKSQNQPLSANTLTSLIAFKESSEMQKLLSEILSYTLLPEQMSGLRIEFAKIDKTGSGVITLEALKSVLKHGAKESSWFLTERNIEEIFDSISMSKKEPTIRWHEFVAAGLSMARYDDRNMRLAFERLDTKKRGFLVLEDLADVLGKEGLEEIWRSGMDDLGINSDRISYKDFAKLIKGPGRTGPLALPDSPLVNKSLLTISEDNKIGLNADRLQFSTAPPRRQASRSGPLPAHTGDEFDGLLHDVTNSPLIAQRSVMRLTRDTPLPYLPTLPLLPALAGMAQDVPIDAGQKQGRKRRKKAVSAPSSTSEAGLVMRRGNQERMEPQLHTDSIGMLPTFRDSEMQ